MADSILNYDTGLLRLSECLPGCVPAFRPQQVAIVSGCTSGSTASSFVFVVPGTGKIGFHQDGTSDKPKLFDWDSIGWDVQVKCPGIARPKVVEVTCKEAECCNGYQSTVLNIYYYPGCNTSGATASQTLTYSVNETCNCGSTCAERLSKLAQQINDDTRGYVTAEVVNNATLKLTGVANAPDFEVYSTSGLYPPEVVEFGSTSFGTGADLINWFGKTTDWNIGTIDPDVDYKLYTFRYYPKVPINNQGYVRAGGSPDMVLGVQVGLVAIPETCTSVDAQFCSFLQDPYTNGILNKIANCACTDVLPIYNFCVIDESASDNTAGFAAAYTANMGGNFISVTHMGSFVQNATTYQYYHVRAYQDFLPAVGDSWYTPTGPDGCTDADIEQFKDGIAGGGSTSGTSPL